MVIIEQMNSEEFDTIFSILEESFPKDEYRSYEGQKKLMDEPAYTVYGCRDAENRKLLAVLTAWEFDGFIFFEHFAVTPGSRNTGIGGRMLCDLLRRLKKPVCLEVELPKTTLSGRRIGFYERNGFCLNPYPYWQPPIEKGRNPIPLRLMTSGRPVTQEEYEQIKKILYTKVYQVSKDWVPEEER